ncbi:MAG: hypothetical protein KBG83_01620 [Bacteroidetes bacterium]|nr:hypothetical protein [Bacteroidota bacterium]
MKTLKPYIVITVVTFVLAVATIAALMYFSPSTLSIPSAAPADSSALAGDSTKVKTDTTSRVSIDSVSLTVKWKDSVAVLRQELSLRDKQIAELQAQIRRNIVATDSLKTVREVQYAKLLESMPPEDAAKVLSNLKDSEVKSILLKIKTKQAGKILSALEPKRVARIMK